MTGPEPIQVYVSSNVSSTFGGGHGAMALKNPPWRDVCCQPLPNSMEVDAAKVAFESFGEVGKNCAMLTSFFSDEENQEVNLRERKKNCELLRLSFIIHI